MLQNHHLKLSQFVPQELVHKTKIPWLTSEKNTGIQPTMKFLLSKRIATFLAFVSMVPGFWMKRDVYILHSA